MISGDKLADNQAPAVAGFSAPNVGEPQIGQSSYEFTITYADDSAIEDYTKAIDIDPGDVLTVGDDYSIVGNPGSIARIAPRSCP